MKRINAQQIDQLRNHVGWMSVTMYVPITNNSAIDRITLKNARKLLESEFKGSSGTPAITKLMLQNIDKILQKESQWGSSGALAIFANPYNTQHYHLTIGSGQFIQVGHQYVVDPVENELGRQKDFYVLALSKKHPRLFKANETGIVAVGVDNIALPLKEALKLDEVGPDLQTHRSGRNGRSSRSETIHGHGSHKDLRDLNTRKYLTHVDSVLRSKVGANAQIIVAGVDYLSKIYKKISKLPEIQVMSIGNPDKLSEHELFIKIAPLLQA